MLDGVESALRDARVPHARIDGQTSAKQRFQRVDAFQKPISQAAAAAASATDDDDDVVEVDAGAAAAAAAGGGLRAPQRPHV